jgi:Uma2 family endonuclease
MSGESIPQTAPVWAYASGVAMLPASDSVSGSPSNIAEIWLQVGQVPLQRIRSEPAPGTATVDDAIHSRKKTGVNCELVNGTLVAKTMGHYESQLAIIIAHWLYCYLDEHPLGILAGEDGPYQMLPKNVRKPDVSFLSFARIPKEGLTREAACSIAPDLAVEVLSPGNTVAEMELKRNQYFAAGVHLVWEIDPATRCARAYSAVDKWEEVNREGKLRGGDVLPGFELSLAKLFEKAGPRVE